MYQQVLSKTHTLYDKNDVKIGGKSFTHTLCIPNMDRDDVLALYDILAKYKVDIFTHKDGISCEPRRWV
jgi:hypothetical protein